MTSWSILKKIISDWMWDMVVGREDIITISITGKLIPCVLFLCWLPWNMHSDRSERVLFMCSHLCMKASFCMHVLGFKCRNALYWRSHYHHVRLTFWLLSGSISKVIILWLPAYYLPTKAPLWCNLQISPPWLEWRVSVWLTAGKWCH